MTWWVLDLWSVYGYREGIVQARIVRYWSPFCESLCHVSAHDRYLFNPYTLATCLARSTTALDNTLLLLAICCAGKGTHTLVVGAKGRPDRLGQHHRLVGLSYISLPYPALTDNDAR